jgi:hypothetical protein
LRAAGDLSQRAGYEVDGIAVLIDLRLESEFRWGRHRARSALQYS